MDWSWLFTLVCPLMMLLMIFFMIKGNKSEHLLSDEQQTKMKMEIDMLTDQNKAMLEILEQVKHKQDLSK